MLAEMIAGRHETERRREAREDERWRADQIRAEREAEERRTERTLQMTLLCQSRGAPAATPAQSQTLTLLDSR